MKFAALLILTSILSANVFACEASNDPSVKVYDCQSISSETSIVTREGRLIFISQNACLKLHKAKMEVDLTRPGNGTWELTIARQSSKEIFANAVERAYPSGSFRRSYTVNHEATLSATVDSTMKLKLKSYRKSLGRGGELKYLSDYNCTQL
ncbi:MAG: hypothetical protein ACLGG0_10920 [Bacteriovoracia bacterium]